MQLPVENNSPQVPNIGPISTPSTTATSLNQASSSKQTPLFWLMLFLNILLLIIIAILCYFSLLRPKPMNLTIPETEFASNVEPVAPSPSLLDHPNLETTSFVPETAVIESDYDWTPVDYQIANPQLEYTGKTANSNPTFESLSLKVDFGIHRTDRFLPKILKIQSAKQQLPCYVYLSRLPQEIISPIVYHDYYYSFSAPKEAYLIFGTTSPGSENTAVLNEIYGVTERCWTIGYANNISSHRNPLKKITIDKLDREPTNSMHDYAIVAEFENEKYCWFEHGTAFKCDELTSQPPPLASKFAE